MRRASLLLTLLLLAGCLERQQIILGSELRAISACQGYGGLHRVRTTNLARGNGERQSRLFIDCRDGTSIVHDVSNKDMPSGLDRPPAKK